jgi:hypothetical protein
VGTRSYFWAIILQGQARPLIAEAQTFVSELLLENLNLLLEVGNDVALLVAQSVAEMKRRKIGRRLASFGRNTTQPKSAVSCQSQDIKNNEFLDCSGSALRSYPAEPYSRRDHSMA